MLKPYNFEEPKMPIKTCIILVGGAGLNLALKLKDVPDVYCIDTCDKNITDGHKGMNVFVTKGTRGGGKNRKYMLDQLRKLNQIQPVIDFIPEADFYILGYGLGGASGSTLAPLITNALADRGAAFVSFVIGATESTEVLDNDRDTLKSLEAISVRKKTPVVINYTPNTSGASFDAINNGIAENINRVVCLTNQRHGRLDFHDVANWVRFTDKHQELLPQICELHIVTSRADAENVPEPISIASLYLDPNKEQNFGANVVRTTGIIDPTDTTATDEQMHFIINTVGVTEIMKNIKDSRIEMGRQQAKFVQRSALVDSDDIVDEDGMVV